MRRWWEQASCRGLAPVGGEDDPFFPDGDKGSLPNAVCVMCFDCPVKLECRMEGYAEPYGYFGNTSADWRIRTRRRIFRRLWPEETMALDGHKSLRSKITDLVRLSAGDLCDAMLRRGFTRDEIAVFAGPSPLDRRAMDIVKRQENDRTTYSWRTAAVTPLGSL